MNTDPAAALRTAYLTTNTALLLTTMKYMTSGCTCVTIYAKNATDLLVANVGDSRAVVAFCDEHGAMAAKSITRVSSSTTPRQVHTVLRF